MHCYLLGLSDQFTNYANVKRRVHQNPRILCISSLLLKEFTKTTAPKCMPPVELILEHKTPVAAFLIAGGWHRICITLARNSALMCFNFVGCLSEAHSAKT